MSYPVPALLSLPVQPYRVGGYHFGQRLRRRIILWATHLGDDVVVPAGTPVQAVSAGEVVWAEVRPGSATRRNWGGIVILGHTHQQRGTSFYSLYGHLDKITVKVGETTTTGQVLGVVADSNTPENGWWEIPHLHFAIYTGPWENKILPGYARPEQRRTRLAWWRDPQTFITEYNLAHTTKEQENER